MASGAKGVFKHDTSAAFIKIVDDGTMSLFVGLPDMGQSSHTAMAMIAAEALAAARLGVKASQLVFCDRQVYPKGEPEKAIPLKKIVYDTLHSREGRAVMGRGFCNSPKESGTMAYSFGAQIAEVTIDPDTGFVTVDRIVASHDVGRAINLRIVEGQIFSGMSQVLYEETLLENGQVMNPSRLDYHLPRSYEMLITPWKILQILGRRAKG